MMENIREMGVLLGFYCYFCHAVRVCASGYRGVKNPIRRKSEQGYVVRKLKRKHRIKLRN